MLFATWKHHDVGVGWLLVHTASAAAICCFLVNDISQIDLLQLLGKRNNLALLSLRQLM